LRFRIDFQKYDHVINVNNHCSAHKVTFEPMVNYGGGAKFVLSVAESN